MRHVIDLDPATYTGAHVEVDPVPGRGVMVCLHFATAEAAGAARGSLVMDAPAGPAVLPATPPTTPEVGPMEVRSLAVAVLLARIPPDTPPEMIRLRVGDREYRHGDDPAEGGTFIGDYITGVDPAAEGVTDRWADAAFRPPPGLLVPGPQPTGGPVPTPDEALADLQKRFGHPPERR